MKLFLLRLTAIVTGALLGVVLALTTPARSQQPVLPVYQLCNDATGTTICNYPPVTVCPYSASVSVNAANTTQIVGLTSGQSIRVCSFSLSLSAAGTVQFVYGTGTNCGTGTTALSGAMTLATGTPASVSTGGGALLYVPASNAFCVAAVTGNANGFISYAKD